MILNYDYEKKYEASVYCKKKFLYFYNLFIIVFGKGTDDNN